jgi:hypothetical protein
MLLKKLIVLTNIILQIFFLYFFVITCHIYVNHIVDILCIDSILTIYNSVVVHNISYCIYTFTKVYCAYNIYVLFVLS